MKEAEEQKLVILGIKAILATLVHGQLAAGCFASGSEIIDQNVMAQEAGNIVDLHLNPVIVEIAKEAKNV